MHMADDVDKRVALHVLTEYPNALELEVDKLQESLKNTGLWLDRIAIIRFFQRLESFGHGKVVNGRHGRETRMRWRDQPNRMRFFGDAPGATASNTAKTFDEHHFPLRDGMDPIRLVLPRDLSAREASRLAQFITSLPVDAG
jgi:hypothetical protein